MIKEIKAYNNAQTASEKKICEMLMTIIDKDLSGAESKVWHRHPVWFLAGNPIVGYGKLKAGIRLMFWSGADFAEADLELSSSGKFKDASIIYTDAKQIDEGKLKRWLKKAEKIQWDYKNIIKRKGKLVRLK